LKKLSLARYVVLFGVLFLVSGCGLWSNFTTYFNLYYNTVDVYSQAESSMLDTQKDPFSLNDVPLPSTTAAQFNKVIEKASKILQFGSKSMFVDDALMMLGKSFYYQKSYIKALRKFQELVTAHPESDLVLDAELWQAKTEMQLKDYAKGLPILESVKEDAKKAGREDVLTDIYIEEIKYNIVRENNEKAIELCSQLVKVAGKNSLIARTLFTMGSLYQKLGKYEDAIRQYELVEDYSPTYDMAFEARNRYGKMLLNLNRPEEAMEVFRRLRTEDKFKEFYDIVDLSIGISLRQMNRPADAYRQLKMCDTTYGSSVQSGGIRYEIAQLYEINFRNYDSAATYYQKALSSTSSADYLQLIRAKSVIFSKYTALINTFNENQRQYFYAVYPEEFKKDSIAFADTSSVGKEVNPEQDKQDSLGTAAVVHVAERERNFEALFEKENAALDQSQKVEKKGAPKKPVLPADSLRTLLAKNTYELGNLFMTELNIPDSAFIYYNLGINSFSETEYYCRSLLAIANYYAIMNDTLKADSIYNAVYENYKDDRAVNIAATQLKKPLIDFDSDPAKKQYADAEGLLLSNDYKKASTLFYSIYQNSPKSLYAAKSLMAVGYILEDKLRLGDSAAVVYDTLLSKYPNSDYAHAIYPKITFYKETKKAIADSIAAVNDSIKATKKAESEKKEAGTKPEAAVHDSVKTIMPPDSLSKTDTSAAKIQKPKFENDEDLDQSKFKEKTKPSLKNPIVPANPETNKVPDSVTDTTTHKDSSSNLVKPVPPATENTAPPKKEAAEPAQDSSGENPERNDNE
jgi:tetratricopeptide (TPR) repeat protein